MKPVVTPEEMAAIDAAAPEPVEELIGRAGAATARATLRLLGGAYGRRVVVVAGKGNNGKDGHDAAARLRRRGLRVQVFSAAEMPPALPPADLVIDAAYGTGFHGEFQAPALTPRVGKPPGSRPLVLAVDIPSGVDGHTGAVGGRPWAADATVTFAALKPGLLFPPGARLTGRVEVADIGLDVTGARAGLVEPGDVAAWVPERPPSAHKWQSALLVVAGSPGMTGAAVLACAAAARAGAGMVRYVVPGVAPGGVPQMPLEAVGVPGTEGDWEETVASELGAGRLHALVIGPGLGLSSTTQAAVPRLVSGPARDLPVVVDGDGLAALAAGSRSGQRTPDILGRRTVAAVLTPHDGEMARLTGAAVGTDRCGAARGLAERSGAVVLLKGPVTVVAHPDGRVRLGTSGDQRLATAGTGDVLSGVIGALLAQGVAPFEAAAAGAWLHGTAARGVLGTGLVASDIVAALPTALSDLR